MFGFKKIIGFLIIVGLFLTCLSIVHADMSSDEYEVILPKNLPGKGCPMAHCDGEMSDLVNLSPPEEIDSEPLWVDLGVLHGSDWGIGCSGNGEIVACSFKNFDGYDNVIVYDPYEPDPNRVRKWTSGKLFNGYAYASAPLVTKLGEVIACDNTQICRFDPNGKEIWCRSFPQTCTPISPVITESGVIILATDGGPVYAYNSKDGALCDQAFITEDGLVREKGINGFFETINTPCVKENRIYISTQHNIYLNQARLVAIDLDPNQKFQFAWEYIFGGPSGASPLLIEDTIYFDGWTGTGEPDEGNYYNDTAPRINNNGQIVWCRGYGDISDVVLYDTRYLHDPDYEPIKTQNPYNDIDPQINNNGQVVWCKYDGEDYEIFLYDNNKPYGLDNPKQLSDNAFCDASPQINDNGQVVWRGYDGEDYDIYFYDYNKPIGQNNPKSLSAFNPYNDLAPQINNEGLVVWYGFDGEDREVFVHDGTKLIINTVHHGDDIFPQINDKGQIAWCRCEDDDCEIFLYDTKKQYDPLSNPKQLSRNYNFDYLSKSKTDCRPQPQINNKGQVVWHGYDGEDLEIFLYDSNRPNQISLLSKDPNLSNDPNDNLYPQINDKGQVVWYGHDGEDFEVFLYTPDEKIIYTTNSYDDCQPQINNNGQVVWSGYDGTGYEIFLYNNEAIGLDSYPKQISKPDEEMPTIFAIKDLGAFCEMLWTQRTDATILASFAKDPREGFWYFPFETTDLIRLGNDGSSIQQINLNDIFNDQNNQPFWPFSVMTIASEDPDNPVMIVSAKSGGSGGAYVIAIDLAQDNSELLWKFKISDKAEDYTAGQFPIVKKKGKHPRVIFTNNNSGTYCIGIPE